MLRCLRVYLRRLLCSRHDMCMSCSAHIRIFLYCNATQTRTKRSKRYASLFARDAVVIMDARTERLRCVRMQALLQRITGSVARLNEVMKEINTQIEVRCSSWRSMPSQ